MKTSFSKTFGLSLFSLILFSCATTKKVYKEEFKEKPRQQNHLAMSNTIEVKAALQVGAPEWKTFKIDETKVDSLDHLKFLKQLEKALEALGYHSSKNADVEITLETYTKDRLLNIPVGILNPYVQTARIKAWPVAKLARIPVWEVEASARTEDKDISESFNYILAAAMPYFGKNSNGTEKVFVKNSDENLKKIEIAN